MSEYDHVVQKQRDLIEAEKWSAGVKSIHAHSLSSMWYDTRPQDTAEGKGVVDIEYNNGTVERRLHNDEVFIFGKALTGQDLLDAYRKYS